MNEWMNEWMTPLFVAWDVQLLFQMKSKQNQIPLVK